jgi:Glycosyl transferase family 2
MPIGPTTVLKAPVRVLCIDVEAPLPDLSLPSEEGAYQSALVFFQRGARVVGHAHVDVPLSGQVVAQRGEAAAQGDRHAADDDPPVALPRVSVVVPTTFDRVEPLERTLRSLLAQTHPDFEVIIVDNRPQATPERAAHHERLRIDPRITIV